jgi:hypothetical protein
VVQLPQGFTAQSFQWFRNGVAISGADQSSYATTAVDAGQFTVQSYGLLNGAPRLLASPSALVQAVNNGSAPLSLGSQAPSPYQIGDLLQAGLGVDLDGSPTTPVTYVWERLVTPGGAWESIANATESTYTVVAADSGVQLRARAFYLDAQGFNNESTSTNQSVGSSPSPGPAPIGGGGGGGGGGGVGGGANTQSLPPTAALAPAETLPTAGNPHAVLPLAVQIQFGFVKRGISGVDDEIIGTPDRDVIGNGPGAKRMRGLEGSDGYLFDQSLTSLPGDVDTIVGFMSGTDEIYLDKRVFPGLRKISFRSVRGKKSLLKEARMGRSNIIYRADQGSLWYDANASRAGFGVGGRFANLEGAPLLAAGDLFAAPDEIM